MIDLTSLPGGGSWVPKSELTLKGNRFCIPIYVEGNDSVQLILQVYSQIGGSLPPLDFQLISQEKALAMKNEWKGRTATEKHLLEGSFWGILFLCLMLAGFQFYFSRDKAFVFYFLYTAAISIYYIRSIEGPWGGVFNVNTEYGKYIHASETSLQYLIFGFYTFFIFHFLELKKSGRSKTLVRIFQLAGVFFLSMVVIDQVLHMMFGVFVSWDVYSSIRLLFFPVAALSIGYLLMRRKEVSNLFILIGTLFLIIPATFTFFEQIADGRWGHRVSAGLYREFYLQKLDMSLFMYSTRIGVILEIICFTSGLSYKNREVIKSVHQGQEDTSEIQDMEKVSDPFLIDVNAIIEKHMTEERFNPTRLAKYLGIAESTLNRKLNALKGKSTANYIRAQKMQKASEFLLGSQMRISEIAAAVGIPDLSYFSRSFREEFGISPRAYRRSFISEE